jgi:hypothetical protein
MVAPYRAIKRANAFLRYRPVLSDTLGDRGYATLKSIASRVFAARVGVMEVAEK